MTNKKRHGLRGVLKAWYQIPTAGERLLQPEELEDALDAWFKRLLNALEVSMADILRPNCDIRHYESGGACAIVELGSKPGGAAPNRPREPRSTRG